MMRKLNKPPSGQITNAYLNDYQLLHQTKTTHTQNAFDCTKTTIYYQFLSIAEHITLEPNCYSVGGNFHFFSCRPLNEVIKICLPFRFMIDQNPKYTGA